MDNIVTLPVHATPRAAAQHSDPEVDRVRFEAKRKPFQRNPFISDEEREGRAYAKDMQEAVRRDYFDRARKAMWRAFHHLNQAKVIDWHLPENAMDDNCGSPWYGILKKHGQRDLLDLQGVFDAIWLSSTAKDKRIGEVEAEIADLKQAELTRLKQRVAELEAGR